MLWGSLDCLPEDGQQPRAKLLTVSTVEFFIAYISFFLFFFLHRSFSLFFFPIFTFSHFSLHFLFFISVFLPALCRLHLFLLSPFFILFHNFLLYISWYFSLFRSISSFLVLFIHSISIYLLKGILSARTCILRVNSSQKRQ